MYGTVMIGKLRDGEPSGLVDVIESWKRSQPAKGFVDSHLLSADDGRVVMAVRFRTREDFEQLASSTAQDEWWNRLTRPLLAEEPVWIDGDWIDGSADQHLEGDGPARSQYVPITPESQARNHRIGTVPIRLESPRLIIRALHVDDQEPWLAMFTDAAVRRFLPGSAPTPESFATGLVSRHEMEEELGYALWAVEEKSTGDFVGQCGLRPARTMDASAGSEIDLAYHFTSNTWNHGYATEAVVAVLAYALGADGPRLERVMAVAMPENVGSWRVMEKAGMRYEGKANYYGVSGLKKYAAERAWWTSPATVAPST